jgi:gluconate 5-dehydrogenase
MTVHPFDLTGKVALVTGAYRGLGYAMAQGLGEAGALVVLNGRNPDALAGAVRSLADRDVRAFASVFDVTDRAAVRASIGAIEAQHGRIDILINNAGIQRRNPLVDFKQEDWDAIIATNLTAPFLVSQAVLPGMIARKSGKIIHVASLMSELARPTVVPYTAAKGGVRQLTRGMAVELAPHNIQVNAIAPGYFATEMNRALIDNVEFNAWVCKRTPAGRWGEPNEIAGLAVFLASAAANYITGQLLVIDGGMSVAL